jgi:hypothetical protein
VYKHFSQAPEQNDWQEFKPLFGGGKIKLCDTLRAVTPFGGLSVFIEFLGRIGLVEQLASRTPYQPKSANHYDPGQILVGFILTSSPVLSVLPTPISYGPIELYTRCLA